jgi:hypothetical protein
VPADEEEQRAVPADEEAMVQQSWPRGPIETSLLTRYDIWFDQVTNCLFCYYFLSYIDEVIKIK